MIHYLTGDATIPAAHPAIIAHIVNNAGSWGAGFVLAVSRRWLEPEAAYLRWVDRVLGVNLLVPVGGGLWVANMCAQDNLRRAKPPVRYEALESCLYLLAREAHRKGASIHMPRIGCGIGGGTWDKVEPIIVRQTWGLDVYVYDLPTPARTW